MPRRVGLLGGTFDPVHIGHLRVAEEAVEALSLDTFLFIPAATPPHKPDRRIESFEDRLRMLQLAVADHPCFQVSDIEQRLSGKSYSVVTLRELRKEYPEGTEFFFLVGLDAFWELDTWYEYRDLFRLASLVVLRRPGYPEDHLGHFLRQSVSPSYGRHDRGNVFRHPSLYPVHYLTNTHLEISSSRIRYLVAEGRSIRYLVPLEILRYITEKNLYGREALATPDEKRERKAHAGPSTRGKNGGGKK
jgi:nicotinate-nucleotide adenylyltransferase